MYIYLGSIIVSFVTNVIVVLKIAKDIENKGYKLKKDEKNIFDEILTVFQYLLVSAVPLGNILLSGILVFSADKLSKSFIRGAVKDGVLVKKEEPKIIQEIEINNNPAEDVKVVFYKVENKEKKEMTREEKLEFLKQEYERLTGEEIPNNNKKQYGIGKRRR